MKTGRNDPCPCGSGKKYKKCCLSPGILAARKGCCTGSRLLQPLIENEPESIDFMTWYA